MTARVLPIAEVVRHAQAAGFRGEALAIAVAVAKAESGLDASAQGDLALVTSTWGPSVGLWQIRSLYAEHLTGRSRDAAQLQDPAFNARSAYAISSGGTNFKPWTMFTNGQYKQHLTAARAAAGGALTGAPLTAVTVGKPILTNVPKTIGPRIPIRIGGVLAQGYLGNAVHGGKVDLSTSEVSEVTIELEDPNLRMQRRYRMNIDSPVDTYGLALQVVEPTVKQGPASEHIVLRCHPRGAVRMRGAVPSATSGISPTEYMRACATAAGLRFVGEPSGIRDVGPQTVEDRKSGVVVKRQQTAWEVGEHWAQQLGFIAFESAGTYFFGSPRWLADRGRKVQISWRGVSYPSAYGDVLPALECPTVTAGARTFISAGTVLPGVDGTTITYHGKIDVLSNVRATAKIERKTGERLRPGMSVAIAGTPPVETVGLLLTRVSWSMDDLTSPVTIEAASTGALAGPGRTAEDDTAARTGGAPARGSRSALDMVTFMLRQVGDKYVYGAETLLDDPDPDAFDCSELIQWACAQVGVSFVDGSSNQISAVRRAGLSLSVAAAAKVRGAVMWRPGHIAVSLGDGQHTVEARGRQYGVVQYQIGTRFTAAGKIPGLRYG